MDFLSVGYGNIVAVDKIISIAQPESSPIRRLIQDAKDSGKLIDLSCGKKTRSVIVTDCDYLILSALTTEMLYDRINQLKNDPGKLDFSLDDNLE